MAIIELLQFRFDRAARVGACLMAVFAGTGVSCESSERAILTQRFGRLHLAEFVASAAAFHPYPTVDRRAPWENLPAERRAALISAAEPLLNYSWPQLPATLYMDFARTGSRQRYEQPYFARPRALRRLVLAECAEGSGRFLDDIINGIWAICEESTWVISGHNPGPGLLLDASVDPSAPHLRHPIHPKHYIEMSTHITGAQLAWVHYLLQSRLDAIDPLISARIRREIKSRVLDVFIADTDYDRMDADKMMLNNHAPWACKNCLSCFLLVETDPQRRIEAVRKVMYILDRFLMNYPADGGCDEGPGYWSISGGSLFSTLELLRSASGGRIDIYDEPRVQEIARYIYRVHISGDYFVNFADAPAKIRPNADLVYRYGQRIGDERMMAFGRFLNQQRERSSGGRTELLLELPDLFEPDDGFSADGAAPLPRDVWFPGVQVMAARDQEGSDRGFFLAAKGGHNRENHNHNDVGQFVVYLDGSPILIDPGIGTYTRQTFSQDRWKLWTVQSAYHNLPTVNGVMQEYGAEFRASDVSYHADDKAAEFSLNIAGAYPRESGMRSWRRSCLLSREGAGSVKITDEFVLDQPSQDLTLSLMTPLLPEVSAAGVVELGDASLLFDADVLNVAVEPIELEDGRLQQSWGQTLYRLVLQESSPVEKGTWVVQLVKKSTGVNKAPSEASNK